VGIAVITVIEVPLLEGQVIQGLIGRDVLAHGILIYLGYTNTFSNNSAKTLTNPLAAVGNVDHSNC
jgi:hypothetical protein